MRSRGAGIWNMAGTNVFRRLVGALLALSYPRRFALVGSLCLLLLAFLGYGLYRSTQDAVDFTAKERQGIPLLERLTVTSTLLERHRYLAMSVAVGRYEYGNKLLSTRLQLGKLWDAVPGASLLNDTPRLRALWNYAAAGSEQATQGVRTSPDAVRLDHDGVALRLQQLTVEVCDYSNLTLDPDEDSYYLADSLCTKLPRLRALAGELASLALPPPAAGLIDRQIELRALLREYHHQLDLGLGHIQHANPPLRERVLPVHGPLDQTLAALSLSPPSPADTMAMLDHLQAASLQTLPQLDQLLLKRIDTLQGRRNAYMTLALGSALGCSLLFALLYLSIRRQLGTDPAQAQDLLRHLARGELDAPLPADPAAGSLAADLVALHAALEQSSATQQATSASLNYLMGNLESQVQARTRQLQDTLQQTAVAARIKGGFLAALDREIRIPLHGVQAVTRLLSDAAPQPRRRACSKLLEQSCAALCALLDDMLDFTRLEAGQMELADEAFLLKPALDGWLAPHLAQARSRGLMLQLSIAPDLPVRARGDGARLRLLLDKLLQHSIRRTARGGVTLNLQCEDAGDEGLLLRGSVRDTGPTLPALLQPGGAPESTGANHDVTLLICQRLAHAFGGELEQANTPGRGNEVRFHLRLRHADADDMPPPASEDGRPLPAQRVLLADGNPIGSRLASLLLEDMGHQVDVAGTGHAAVELTLQGGHRILLLSTEMPDMDAHDMLRFIVNHASPTPYIVMVGPRMDDAERQRWLQLGARGTLERPFFHAELQQQLRAALAGHYAEQESQDTDSCQRESSP